MDVLGKKGEEASEEVEAVIEAVEDLNSHMNALDNAVQQHDQELDQIVDNLRREEEFLQNIEFNRSRVEKLKKLFTKFARVQSSYIENVDVLDSEIAESQDNISRIETRISKIESTQNAIFDEIDDVKDNIEEVRDRIDEIESEFILDTNRQEWDIESKVDESEFEKKFSKRENYVDEELAKLKTSLNNVIQKIEDDEITLE